MPSLCDCVLVPGLGLRKTVRVRSYDNRESCERDRKGARVVGGTEPDRGGRAGTDREGCGRARCSPTRKNREGFMEEVLFEAV